MPNQIQCPHCGLMIPVTKPKKPPSSKKDLRGMLGDHWDDYWAIAKLFGPTKNYAPSQSAKAYLDALAQTPHSEIYDRAKRLSESTEQRYLPQLAKWLEGQAYLEPYKEETNASNSRLAARSRAE